MHAFARNLLLCLLIMAVATPLPGCGGQSSPIHEPPPAGPQTVEEQMLLTPDHSDATQTPN